MARISAGAVPSPNIWNWPAVYEIENAAADPDQLIEQAMGRIRPLDVATFLDLGCGTGYHLPRWATRAAQVVGVEPHRDLVALARRRCRRLTNVSVLQGAAQAIPLPDASVDVLHARWAYFFGPGAEPGLRELQRVVRHGGIAFVVDNDATRSTFGAWFWAARPSYDPSGVEQFWSQQGFAREAIDTCWRFRRRSELESVIRIEFAAADAERILDSHDGLEFDYAINLWWRAY